MSSKNDGAASKCLMVLEKILECPAVSRDQIADDLRLNRSAVYRAIKTLAGKGYVRPTLCGTRYRMTEHAERVFSAVSVSHESADDIALEVSKAAKRFSVHADIALIERPGIIRNFETTDRLRALSSKPLRLAWSSLAQAALSQMSSKQRERHLESYMCRASKSEITELRSADFGARLDRIAEAGGVIEETGTGIAHALINRATGDVAGAVRFRHYVNSKCYCSGCTDCVVARMIRGTGPLTLTTFSSNVSNPTRSVIAWSGEK